VPNCQASDSRSDDVNTRVPATEQETTKKEGIILQCNYEESVFILTLKFCQIACHIVLFDSFVLRGPTPRDRGTRTGSGAPRRFITTAS
jgi:hypothetical protein